MSARSSYYSGDVAAARRATAAHLRRGDVPTIAGGRRPHPRPAGRSDFEAYGGDLAAVLAVVAAG